MTTTTARRQLDRASLTPAHELWARAEQADARAAEATLPHVRAVHEQAAAKWRELALRRERARSAPEPA